MRKKRKCLKRHQSLFSISRLISFYVPAGKISPVGGCLCWKVATDLQTKRHWERGLSEIYWRASHPAGFVLCLFDAASQQCRLTPRRENCHVVYINIENAAMDFLRSDKLQIL